MRARRLTPLDPMRFMFLCFAAYVQLVAGDFEQAYRDASESLDANRQHLPTYPILIVSEMASGREGEARAHARQFLAAHPGMSVTRYAERHRGPSDVRDHAVRCLIDAGLPA